MKLEEISVGIKQEGKPELKAEVIVGTRDEALRLLGKDTLPI